MSHMDQVRARAYDPQMLIQAQQTANAITARLDETALQAKAAQVKRAASKSAKVVLLRELADTLGTAAKGLVPCKAGCTHCCHIPALICVEEAQVIAKETGAKLSMPTRFDAKGNDAYIGVPCVFLKNDQCSIYAHRPFVCRVHFTLDADDLLCRIVPGEAIRQPSLDNRNYDIAYCNAFGEPLNMRFADIRDFFK